MDGAWWMKDDRWWMADNEGWRYVGCGGGWWIFEKR